MRESFVFHAEYIEDLPEEYKSRFAMYAINYGLNGEAPTLEGLELTIWIKIQRRIDSDIESWEEKKASRSEAGKLGGLKSGEARSRTKQNEANEAKVNFASESEANEAVNVNDSFSVVCSGVNVSVAPDGASENTTDTVILQKIKEIDGKYSLNLTSSQKNKIDATLSANNLDISYLDYVAVYLKKTYKEITPALFFSAVCTWENLRADFSSAKPKIRKKIPDLSSCRYCGASSLAWINPNMRHCKKCHTDFIFKNNEWSKAE